jgi:ABC-type lipoprotein release transport system permease subunit
MPLMIDVRFNAQITPITTPNRLPTDLSGDIYFIDFLPSELHWLDVFYVLVTALLLSLLATLAGSIRLARRAGYQLASKLSNSAVTST